MATREWLGNALAVAPVKTWTFAGTWEADDIIDATCNGKIISITAGSTVAATIAATVQAALAASTIIEFTEVAWTEDTAVLTGTGRTAGKPYTVTISTRDAGGAADAQTINGGTSSTGTVVTADTGPNHADNTANWTAATLPVSTDDVIIRRPISILYGLTAFAAVVPATLKIYSSFWAGGARIGLPEIAGTAPNTYVEYRSTFMQWDGATLADLGLGESTGGSSIINLDFGTGTVALTVHRTPQSSDQTRPALCLIINPGTVANGKLEVLSGSVGVGFYGESCKVVPKIGYRDNRASDSRVYFGPGVTMGATFDQSGGIVEINTATTAITKTGGTLTINGTGAHPIIDNSGGKLIYNSTGAPGATSIKVGGGATFDYSQDQSPKTQGSAILAYAGAEIINPHTGVVASFAYQAIGCGPEKIKLVGPHNATWTQS